jgi:ankyrin repeat protein
MNTFLEPCVDEDGELHLAAAAGDVLKAQTLRTERPMLSVNDFDTNGETPLYVACWHGRVAFAAWLLDHGADPNERMAETANTALHAVCFRSVTVGWDAIPLLLLRGASVGVASSNGYTPLHAAAFVGSAECCKLLLLAGADPTKRSVAKLGAKDISPSRELADFLAKAEREYLESRKMSRRKSSRRHSIDGVASVVGVTAVTPRLLAVCETLIDTPSISDRALLRTRVVRERSISTPYLHKRSDPSPSPTASEFSSPVFPQKRSAPVGTA